MVREHFSPLTMRIDEERELAVIEGPISFDFPSGTDGTTVRVTLARDHPKSAPMAEDLDDRFPSTGEFHKNPDSKFECLWFPPESPWTGADDDLRKYVAQLVVHIHRQLVCEADAQRIWPGPARPHGATAAYLALFREHFSDVRLANNIAKRWTKRIRTAANEPCICGSGRKFKRCHRTEIETFERYCGGAFRLKSAFGELAKIGVFTE
jgi:SEC-C motif